MVTVRMAKGLDGKLRPSRRVDNKERDKLIVELFWDASMVMRDIAAEVGCSVGTVHRVIKAFDFSKLGTHCSLRVRAATSQRPAKGK